MEGVLSHMLAISAVPSDANLAKSSRLMYPSTTSSPSTCVARARGGACCLAGTSNAQHLSPTLLG